MKTSKRIIWGVASIIILLACDLQLNAQSCPRGVRYDCVWGCGRHTDLDGDGFCDYSFLTQPEKKKTDSVPVKDTVKVIHKDTLADGTTEHQKRQGKGEVRPRGEGRFNDMEGTSTHEAAATDLDAHSHNHNMEADETGPAVTPPSNPPAQEPLYDLIFVSSITLGLYFLTLILYKRNIIKRIHHRKLWNLLLLLTFLVSCLFGFFLVIQLNYNVAMSAFKTLMYWHVEIGISMTIIAVIHILWHLTYFKNMLKKW